MYYLNTRSQDVEDFANVAQKVITLKTWQRRLVHQKNVYNETRRRSKLGDRSTHLASVSLATVQEERCTEHRLNCLHHQDLTVLVEESAVRYANQCLLLPLEM